MKKSNHLIYYSIIFLMLGGFIFAEAPAKEAAYLFKVPPTEAKELIWMDGSKSSLTEKPGQLLSDNDGLYWGASPYTGCRYRYENKSLETPDQSATHPEVFGNRLLDGQCRYLASLDAVGVSEGPLIVLFSFPGEIRVSEIDCVSFQTPLEKVQIQIKEGNAQEWKTVHEATLESAPEKDFYRFKLQSPASTKEIRFLVEGAGQTLLSEVFIWGEGKHQAGVLKGIPQEMGSASRERMTLEPEALVAKGREATDFERKIGTKPITLKTQNVEDPLTKAWVEFDASGWLLVRVECQEPQMGDRLIDDPKGRAKWEDDAVEVFINATAANRDQYYHFGMNSEGKALRDWDRVIDPTADGEPFHFDSSIKKEGDRWVAQFKIPLYQMLVAQGKLEQDWNFLVARSRRIKKEGKTISTQSSWPIVTAPILNVAGNLGVLTVKKEPAELEKRFESFPGAPKTSFNEVTFNAWRQKQAIGNSSSPLIYSIDPYRFKMDLPFLPETKEVTKLSPLRMIRNEIEGVTFILMNPSLTESMKVRLETKDSWSGAKSAESRSELFIGAAQWMRLKGVMIKPLFQKKTLLGERQMEKYFTNGEQIKSFPDVTIPPGGSIYLYQRWTIQELAAGNYESQMLVNGKVALTIPIEVVNSMVPEPFHWGRSFGGSMDVWPFRYDHHFYQVARARAEGGINVSEDTQFLKSWRGEYNENCIQYAEAKMATKDHFFNTFGIPEKILVEGFQRKLQPPLSDAHKAEIKAYWVLLKAKIKSLGIADREWFVELWDEPVPESAPAYGEISRYLKELDSTAVITCNPSFWTGTGFAEDEVVFDKLKDWHQLIDIWCPVVYLMDAGKFPKSHVFHQGKSNRINAYYVHPPHGRKMGWFAIQNNLNGYAYYSDYRPDNNWRPSSNPYNDFDGSSFDYVTLYPSMNGPIISTQSEEMRESFEDYKMLRYLRESGKEKGAQEILKLYQDLPVDRQYENDYPSLRQKLINQLIP